MKVSPSWASTERAGMLGHAATIGDPTLKRKRRSVESPVADIADAHTITLTAREDVSHAAGRRTLIVVPCLNEAANLPRLLAQFVAENPEAMIVVADGGSTDGSQEVVADMAHRWPSVRLLDNPQRIQSAGVNLAVATFGANHDWLVRVDAHCGYPANFVARLVDAANRQQATSIVVPMVTRGEDCFQLAAAAAQNSIIGTGGSLHRLAGKGRFVDHGHHALIAIADFVGVGGYDESFSHNEDAELDARLAANGTRIWLEPDATLIYWPRRSPQKLFLQYFNYGKGRARMLAKHGVPLKMRQRLPLLVAPAVVLAAVGIGLAPLASGFLLLLLPALAWAVLCLVFGLWFGVRDRSRCTAFGGIAAVIMHLGWSVGFWHMRGVTVLRSNRHDQGSTMALSPK